MNDEQAMPQQQLDLYAPTAVLGWLHVATGKALGEIALLRQRVKELEKENSELRQKLEQLGD